MGKSSKSNKKVESNFVASLVHDMKTPIFAHINMLNMLLAKKFGSLTNEQFEVLSEMLNSIKFMENLVENILIKCKKDTYGDKLEKKKDNLKQLLQKVCNNLNYILENRKQYIKIIYNTKIEEIYFDRFGIERVLNNIIMNASDFSKESDVINVIVDNDNFNIIVSIIDKGLSLLNKDTEEIFNLYHTDKLVSTGKIGQGLGLYISKNIIEAHGGQIDAQTKVNVGTIFKFTIPLDNSSKYNYQNGKNFHKISSKK